MRTCTPRVQGNHLVIGSDLIGIFGEVAGKGRNDGIAALERSHAEIATDPAFGGGAVKEHARLWHCHFPQNIKNRFQLRIMEHRVRQDQFARINPQDICQKT